MEDIYHFLDGIYARGREGNLGDQIMKKPSPKPLEIALNDIQMRNPDKQVKKGFIYRLTLIMM